MKPPLASLLLVALSTPVHLALALPPETVAEAESFYTENYSKLNLYTLDQDARFKTGWLGSTGGLNPDSSCAFYINPSAGWTAGGNWVNLPDPSYQFAPRTIHLTGATDGEPNSTDSGREFITILEKGAVWKVNWAFSEAGAWTKTYPTNVYNLKTPVPMGSDLTDRKLVATWNFKFGYPDVAKPYLNSKYNVMHELHFKGTNPATGRQAIVEVVLAEAVRQGSNAVDSAHTDIEIGNAGRWTVGYFQLSKASPEIWVFSRPKANYYQSYDESNPANCIPPEECDTTVDIMALLRYLKENPKVAQLANPANPEFPVDSLTLYRSESGIEIMSGRDGSCFRSDKFLFTEK